MGARRGVEARGGGTLKAIRQLAVLAALVAGCAGAAHRPALAPLEREGEVLLVAQPLPEDAARLTIRLGAVSAVRADGPEVPLRLVRTGLSRAALAVPRLVARGRLEPGAYAGFAVAVARASLGPDGAASDLAVAPEPLRVDAPFTIAPRRATVVTLELRPSPANERDVLFAPELTAAPRWAPVLQQSVFCTASGEHEVVVLDRRARSLAAVAPTGRDPWGIALDPVLGRLYVALAGEDAVLVLDAGSREEVARIRLRQGDAPREAALTPDGRILVVANAGSSSVSFVDPVGLLELSRVDVGEVPTGLLLDRSGARAYVSNAGSAFLSVLDVVRRSVVGRIGTGYAPLRPALSRDGARLYVAAPGGSHLAAVSTTSLAEVARTYVGLGATAVKVDPSTDLVYVAVAGARRLTVLDPRSLVAVDYVAVPGDVGYLAIAGAENILLATVPGRGTVAAIELASRRLVAEIDVGEGPRVLALDGGRD